MSVKIDLNGSEEEKLKSMVNVIREQIKASKDSLAIISNATAIMNSYLNRINWVGIYILKGAKLYLGPFQGGPACMEIPLDEGVCGFAARNKKSVIVDDVDKFEGHIACDSRSKSELVVPIMDKDELLALIDIDSPDLNRFTDLEKKYIEEVARIMAPLFLNR